MANRPGSGIRAFIAFRPPSPVLDALEKTQRELAVLIAQGSVRWVDRAAMHLTLVFLGDGNAPERIVQVANVLDELAADREPLSLTLAALGCFPGPRNPRVLWTGLEDPGGHLAALKQALDKRLEPLGFAPEKRPFTPHLTLCRVNDPLGVANHQLPFGQNLVAGAWIARDLELIHSRLTPHGARYTKIHSARLTPADPP